MNITIRFGNEVITSEDMYIIHAAAKRAKAAGLVVHFDTNKMMLVFLGWYRLKQCDYTDEQYRMVLKHKMSIMLAADEIEENDEEIVSIAYQQGYEATEHQTNPYPTPLHRETNTVLWHAWDNGHTEMMR